jgi:hypothetical protein
MQVAITASARFDAANSRKAIDSPKFTIETDVRMQKKKKKKQTNKKNSNGFPEPNSKKREEKKNSRVDFKLRFEVIQGYRTLLPF